MYDSGEGETIQLHGQPDGKCVIQKSISAHPTTFNSIRSWYPNNTSCQYRFSAPQGETIRLEFTEFRVERVTFCSEAVRIYDSADVDPRFIITKLCDTNRPSTENPRSIYESSSNRMLVDFTSKVGSLDGSSITFSFEVRHVRPATKRIPNCGRTDAGGKGNHPDARPPGRPDARPSARSLAAQIPLV